MSHLSSISLGAMDTIKRKDAIIIYLKTFGVLVVILLFQLPVIQIRIAQVLVLIEQRYDGFNSCWRFL